MKLLEFLDFLGFLKIWLLAEGVGFEPTIRLPVYTLSKRAPSATRPSLRVTGVGANIEGGRRLASATRLAIELHDHGARLYASRQVTIGG
jgi:hypothetical protein